MSEFHRILAARAILVVLGSIPTLAGVLWAKHRQMVNTGPVGEYIRLALVLAVMYGTLLVQMYVYGVVGHIWHGDYFTKVLIIVQYLAALVVFFSIIIKDQYGAKSTDA